VFLRLETSWFFAASPMYLLLGPKPTSDLRAVSHWRCVCAGGFAYGVARLETSFAIYTKSAHRIQTVCATVGSHLQRRHRDSAQQQ
jgi:hypothetical protein